MPLTDPTNIFAGNPLDRVSERRTDADWIADQLAAPETCAIALWNGQPLVEMNPIGETRLVYISGALARELAGGEERLLFLGLDIDDEAVFALDMEGPADPAEGALNGRGRFEGLRALAPRLPADEAGVAATAKAVFEWRRRHRFCSMCGQQSEAVDGGWKRKCPACGTEHFPRTDPVAIMLAVNHDRCLLGRQASFPPGMYSALAGFMEPGESIEEACARELYEEAGLRATSVRYHSSQPWPFPSNLMIGLIAQVADGEAVADMAELEDVRWFTRDEARRLMRGEIAGLSCPPPLAIAHQLIRAWAFA
jgi:NAD+ diphosphatase